MKRGYVGAIAAAMLFAGAAVAQDDGIQKFFCEKTGGKWVNGECLTALEMTAVRGAQLYEVMAAPENIIIYGVPDPTVGAFIGVYDIRNGGMWMCHEEALDGPYEEVGEKFKIAFTAWRPKNKTSSPSGLFPCCRSFSIDPAGFSFKELTEKMGPYWSYFVSEGLKNFRFYFGYGEGPGELISVGIRINSDQ